MILMFWGEFNMVVFLESDEDWMLYLVFIYKDVDFFGFILVCLYFECIIGDFFGFKCCDCGE